MKAYNSHGKILNSAYTTKGSSLTGVYAADGTPIPFDIFYSSAIVSALPLLNDVSGNKQGGCTDGTYLYQILIGTSFSFVKYKISDGTYTVFSFGSSVPFNHGNDMAYNPNNQHIYVAAMTNNGAVMELDTDFNYITTHYICNESGVVYTVWGLCFDQKTNHFLSDYGSGDKMIVYDQDFNYIETINLSNIPSATAQGCETDGDYIYHIWYKPNKIHVSAIDGTFVKMIDNPMSGEPETMMYDWTNNRYFISKQSGTDMFYEAEFKQQRTSS